MANSNSVEVTFGYTNTDFKRDYTIDEIGEDYIDGIKDRILAINASIAGGTDGGMSDFYVSDDYDATDPNHIIGKFSGIVAAKVKVVTETDIPVPSN